MGKGNPLFKLAIEEIVLQGDDLRIAGLHILDQVLIRIVERRADMLDQPLIFGALHAASQLGLNMLNVALPTNTMVVVEIDIVHLESLETIL